MEMAAAGYPRRMNLHGTGILLTGASRGLGRALARELAVRGARLLLVARDGPALHRLAADLRGAGGEAHALAADVGDADAVHGIAATAAAVLGDVDVLVHNAAVLGPPPRPGGTLRLLADTDGAHLQRAFEVNALGPFRLTRALVGPMLVRGRGLVVHLTSDAAVHAYPQWGAYGASKAALDHLAATWAAELAGTGVRFLAVDPGEMATDMHRDALPDADPATLARPADVAARLADMLAAPATASGARLSLAAAEGGP